MADPRLDTRRLSASAVGFGTAYLLAGVALLLQELGLLAWRWSLVVPLLMVAVGLVVGILGFTGAHRTRSRR